MKHTDFIDSLKSLKSHFQKKKKPHHYHHPHLNQKVQICTCTDSHGEHKYLYTSKDELEYILSSTSTRLQSYPCPYETGWHLTKG